MSPSAKLIWRHLVTLGAIVGVLGAVFLISLLPPTLLLVLAVGGFAVFFYTIIYGIIWSGR